MARNVRLFQSFGANFAAMLNQTYGSGAFQLLLQAVPCTALVCAATIALLLLLVRILAQSLGSQHRQMQETPRLHPAVHFSHLQTREFDPYWMAPTFANPGPARALDFMNSSPSGSLGASGFDSFNSSPRMHYKSSLTETLSIEVRERFKSKKRRKKLINFSFRYVRVAENFENLVFFSFLCNTQTYVLRHMGEKKEKN